MNSKFFPRSRVISLKTEANIGGPEFGIIDIFYFVEAEIIGRLEDADGGIGEEGVEGEGEGGVAAFLVIVTVKDTDTDLALG